MIEAILTIIIAALMTERYLTGKKHTQDLKAILDESAKERQSLITALIAKSATDYTVAKGLDTTQELTETPPPEYQELDPNSEEEFDQAIDTINKQGLG